MSRRRTLIAFATAVGVMFGATPSVHAAAMPRTRTLDELKARVGEVLRRYSVPGAGIALVDQGRLVWAGGVGFADRDAQRPVTGDTLFRVGSITKSFVALALVKLAEEGRVSLDARVDEIAPELVIGNPWAAEQPITIAHLLEHTAGFDEVHPNEAYGPLSVESLPLATILAKNPRSRVARWRPGSRASYANPGYTVAAYVIEKVTGRPWTDYVRQELFAPLGMNGSALRWSPDADARLARGYDQSGAVVPYRAIYHHPAGGLMTSPRELAALVQLYLARGRVGGRQLVSPESIARMERSETLALHGTDMDYGFANMGDVFLRVPMRGHDGGIDGYLSGYYYDVALGIGFVVMVNQVSERAGEALFEIRHLIVDHLLGDRAPPRPPRAAVPVDELRPWAGSYAPVNPRNQLFAFLWRVDMTARLRFDGRALRFSRWPGAWPEHALVPTGGGRFRFPFATGSHIQVGRDADGRRVVSLFGGLLYLAEEPPWKTLFFYYGARVVIWLLLSALALPIAALFVRRRGVRVGWVAPIVCAASFFSVPWIFFAAARDRALGKGA